MLTEEAAGRKTFKVECRFREEDGKCSGRYDGYVCIEEKCPFYRMIMKGECEYLKDGYCTYYKRFKCPGLGKCDATFGMKRSKEGDENSTGQKS